jgi:tetratricopeptide (TPR) repeat protein
MSTRTIAPLTILLGLTTRVPAADLAGSPAAHEALALCREAERAGAAQAELLQRGLALAERAVETDPTDATAHFALFCNLGRQMQGARLSLASLAGLRRLRREIDRTLELAPDWADALVGKGALLAGTPRFLGGDAAEGERLLRRAVRLAPELAYAHLELARALVARHAPEEARREARCALELAANDPGSSAAAEARTLLGAVEDEAA